jgi:hypothetical protein
MSARNKVAVPGAPQGDSGRNLDDDTGDGNFTTLPHSLIEARLGGRHGLNRTDTLKWLAKRGKFNPVEFRQLNEAFTEGDEARKSGYPCQCHACASLPPSMWERESIRIAYANRRRAELKAAGTPENEIERIVEREIDGGAALQQAPAVIRKASAGGGPSQ